MEADQLTKKWKEYDGDYCKAMQDIRLKNGDEVMMCWPNAGKWMVTKKEGQEKYYALPHIENSDVTHVRETHDPSW